MTEEKKSKSHNTIIALPPLPVTNRKTGLTDAEVTERRRVYGSNTLKKAKKTSFFLLFLKNLGDPIIRILIFALIINILLNLNDPNIAESLGIAVSIFLATLISTLSEYGSEAAFDRLSEQCASSLCRVRRNGRTEEIPSPLLVSGDIVILSAGEKIAADGILVSGSLSLDQSALTGESREIEKHVSTNTSMSPDAPSSLCYGCLILSGEGEMQVMQVGKSTALGKISEEIQEEKIKSPLKERLSRLAKQISLLGYIAAAVIGAVYLLNAIVFDSGFSQPLIALKLSDTKYLLSTLLEAFMLGLTVVVMAVPEGLPMMIAVVLSGNIKKMVRDNVIVRRAVGIEAAGSMNILFTDKTGTLTKGQMSAEELLLGDLTSYKNAKELSGVQSLERALYFNCAVNTAAVAVGKRASGGNATDRALLELTLKNPPRRLPDYTLLEKIPFDSNRKYCSSLIRTSTGKEIYIKGAPEKLLPFIKECLLPDGSRAPFECYRAGFEAKLHSLTMNGARVVLTAFCRGDNIKKTDSLCLCFALSLRDGLRSGAKGAVSTLQGAGIQVVMITGDNKSTAEEIAKRCGILKEGGISLSREELDSLSDSELSDILPRLSLVARALPSDKSRLVRLSQSRGLVVGMTGDGINDAPALRHADVGFAMGSGTQVAKDASDVIILDNDLSSVAKAVLYGRTIFKSIRKFILLQLTMNLCAVAVSMIGPFIGVDSPVTVTQMLWINMIMDTLGGLAFAGEPPLDTYMSEKPKRRDEPILNGYMISRIIFLGAATVTLLITFLLSPDIKVHFRSSQDNIYLLTSFFALFIFSGVFNCFNARTDKIDLLGGLNGNTGFILIMSSVCLIQILFIYLGGEALRTAPLFPSELGYTLLLALLVFPADLITKALHRLFGGKGGY